MALELQIAPDWSGDNVGNANFSTRNIAVDIDVSNCTDTTTAVFFPTGANANPIGVLYDESKLTPSGSVQAASAIAIRSWGIARALANAAVTAGDLLGVAGTSGRVRTQATATSFQNIPILGRALTSASGSLSLPLVLLTIGARI